MSDKIPQTALDFIKKWEGLSLTAYKDIVGVWTIGYGHTGHDVVEGLSITPEKAEDLLAVDLLKFSGLLEQHLSACRLPYHLSGWQSSALLSLLYNCGPTPLAKTLGRRLWDGNLAAVADEILRWNKAGGKVVPGLVKRREAERELFLSG